MKDITIYTTPTCIKCKILKSAFDKNGIKYDEVQDLNEMEILCIKSAPTVMLSDGSLIGFEEAMKLTK